MLVVRLKVKEVLPETVRKKFRAIPILILALIFFLMIIYYWWCNFGLSMGSRLECKSKIERCPLKWNMFKQNGGAGSPILAWGRA